MSFVATCRASSDRVCRFVGSMGQEPHLASAKKCKSQNENVHRKVAFMFHKFLWQMIQTCSLQMTMPSAAACGVGDCATLDVLPGLWQAGSLPEPRSPRDICPRSFLLSSTFRERAATPLHFETPHILWALESSCNLIHVAQSSGRRRTTRRKLHLLIVLNT